MKIFTGGMMGLFVGASFLSFLEILIWIVKLFLACFAKKLK
jgi:hypothetical protein